MTMALGIALVACPAAVGKQGDKGEPGKNAPAVNQPPYVALEIPDATVVAGKSGTVDLSKAFRDPEGATLKLNAESGDTKIAKAGVIGMTLTVTGVAEGSTRSS